MVSPLPSVSPVLSRRLGGFGRTGAFAADLFSPQRDPSPFGSGSMASDLLRDRNDTRLRPVDVLGNKLGESWDNRGLSAGQFAQVLGTGSSFRQGFNQFQGGGGMGVGGGGGQFGGDAAVLNQYMGDFQAAASAYGVPLGILMGVAAVERGWEGTSHAGAIGIMQIMPQFWGHLGNIYDPRENIRVGAQILAQNYRQYGSWDMAIKAYHGFGFDGFTDEHQYLAAVQQRMGEFGGAVAPINGQWGGNPVGNSFVQAAMQYIGVQYVWGAIPGAGQDPWQTGWDCSGFTYFMNQKYGDKSLPMGSHYQYDHAVRTGQLFTNLSMLQPGDLVFIDTGWQGGAGANLNRAGHVGIYIGNGQMIHAANAATGTVISPLSAYGNILGAMHQSTSGGGGVSPGAFGGFAGGFGQPYGQSWGNSVRDMIFSQYRRLWGT